MSIFDIFLFFLPRKKRQAYDTYFYKQAEEYS